MIPTLILVGLLFGRWWRTTLLAGAVGWPLVLVADGAMELDIRILGAVVVAVLNTGVGVLIHQLVLRALRRLRQRRRNGV